MKNSATDRIRAKLADAHPGSDSGDAPEIRDGSAPVSAAVTIDEDYLTSLFGGSTQAETKPAASVVARHSETLVETELQPQQESYASPAEGAVDLDHAGIDEAADRSFENSSYNATSEPVEYEATEETAASRELLAFHSAIESDVDGDLDMLAEVETAAVEDVPAPPAPVVIARAEPVSVPVPQPQAKARVVRIEPVVTPRPPQKNSGKSRSFERNQRHQQNQNQNNNQAAAPPPPMQSREQTVAAPVNRVPPPAPVAPVVAPPVVAPTTVADGAAAPSKNRMLMIAAAAVMVIGGGAAMMFKGAPKSDTPSAPPQQTSQAVPSAAPVPALTEPAPTATTQAAPPPVATPAEPAKTQTTDKSKADPVETAAQQPAKTPVPDGRAAPKQFIAPTVQTARPSTNNPLVSDAAPEIAVNVQGGSIALPGATITGRVAAPPAPKAETPAPVPVATATPAPPVATKAGPTAPPLVANLTRIKTVNPEYPAAAHNGRISGTVAFSITIGKDGKVASVRPISGNPMLLSAARAAISQWVYNPPMVNGQPTEATTNVQLTFNLK